jgi:hypothetical protein
MTDHRPKKECPYCWMEKKLVRRLGKHINRFHLEDIGYLDGADDGRNFNQQWANNADYVYGYEQGHNNS